MFTRRSSVPFLAITLVLASSLSGAAQTASLDPGEAIEWHLVTYLDDGIVELVPPDVRVTLFLSDSDARGSGGCNQFDAAYALDALNITFSDVVSATQDPCEASAQALEDTYLEALGVVQTWEFFGRALDLVDGDGDIVLTFARSPLDVTSDELFALTVTFAHLQLEVMSLREELAALRVSALRNRVSGIEGTITSLQEQVDRQRLTDLRTRVSSLELTAGESIERMIMLRRRVSNVEGRLDAIEARPSPAPSTGP